MNPNASFGLLYLGTHTWPAPPTQLAFLEAVISIWHIRNGFLWIAIFGRTYMTPPSHPSFFLKTIIYKVISKTASFELLVLGACKWRAYSRSFFNCIISREHIQNCLFRIVIFFTWGICRAAFLYGYFWVRVNDSAHPFFFLQQFLHMGHIQIVAKSKGGEMYRWDLRGRNCGGPEWCSHTNVLIGLAWTKPMPR